MSITWVTATDYFGTVGVVAEELSEEALRDWCDNAHDAGMKVEWRQPCDPALHWDGSRRDR